MAINFGGLATGLDTNALITELMKIQRRPVERLETEKSYLNNRQKAFQTFSDKLKGLLGKIEALDTSKEVRSFKATAPTTEFFVLSASSEAEAGNYQVEVKQLSKLQKTVSQGYASNSNPAFGTGTLTLNDKAIDYSGDSLTSLAAKINDANSGETATGVSASIINDGVSGYRLVLTGKDGESNFTATVNETVAGTYAPLAFTTPQSAQQAILLIDQVEVRSKSDVFDGAIPGVTLTATKPNDPGITTPISVAVDQDGVKKKIDDFIGAYNDIIRFIGDQKDADWGKDSSFRSVKGRLQSLLVSSVNGTGSLQNLAALGIETQKDGTLQLDTSVWNKIMPSQLENVEKLLAGEAEVEGIAKTFGIYLSGVTDSVNGLAASRKKNTDSSIRRIDNNIASLERRLEQREKTLRAQFEGLEQLVSTMNSQSTYLSQQMYAMNSLGR